MGGFGGGARLPRREGGGELVLGLGKLVRARREGGGVKDLERPPRVPGKLRGQRGEFILGAILHSRALKELSSAFLHFEEYFRNNYQFREKDSRRKGVDKMREEEKRFQSWEVVQMVTRPRMCDEVLEQAVCVQKQETSHGRRYGLYFPGYSSCSDL